ncbi:hypothetical protein KQI42_19990 [Tissierella sp. MSJ-40]|uniref:Uncharacterized protein n=1 Tax=Tissierella simiarum TaxID=2841534 RepID=A0ABS6EBG8_9FIRM|nr:hypothetical protein [Tissierella simiarum]MBU5440279.1 hypothetical protein [Tissierella simiarum]
MSSIDKKFIVTLQGKEFVTYEGLLDLAHKKGLVGINTELIQIPSKDNDYLAIVKARATTKNGDAFDGIGDADNKNVGSFVIQHKIRMAETRAKARALRDLTNVGMTALEELGEDEENQPMVQSKSLTDKQIARLYAIAKSVDIDAEKVKEQVKKQLGKEITELTKAEYDMVCKGYESLKK